MASTVLIVDDSPTALRVARETVESAGFGVLTATDGIQAVSVATQELPQIVVLDIILPKQNGFQVCRQLKKNSATAGIKVILLSSKSHEMDIVWGHRQGADGYLTKPVEPRQLLDCIRSVLPNESNSVSRAVSVNVKNPAWQRESPGNFSGPPDDFVRRRS